MRGSRWVAAAAAVCGGVALIPGASGLTAALPQQLGAVDLLTQANVQIDAPNPADSMGTSTASAGDVNGDGIGDVIVGVNGADNNGRTDSGSAYVVFGKPSLGTIDLRSLGDGGFRIDGAAAGDGAWVVAGGGDVNGDGRADVIVGAPMADNNGRKDSGSAYVVYGKASTGTVDLATLGPATGGFRIDGAAAEDRAGGAVAVAGDTTGDSRAEVVVGAYATDNHGANSGSAYVIFGAPGSANVDLAALGPYGFRIDGGASTDFAGSSVAGGDVNGDGRADVIVGALFASNNGRISSGSAYVVYGRPGTETGTVDLAGFGPANGGFRIDGAAAGNYTGVVAAAGDMTGDGRSEVIVGGPSTDGSGRVDAGSAYVVFGAPGSANVDLATLGPYGFRIDGAAADDQTGTSVGGGGDVNGDGRADVIVGAFHADNNGRSNSGSAFVVYGRPLSSTGPVDLAALGQAGFRIDGVASDDQAGASVAGRGDVNGDGRADVIVGAWKADARARIDSGSVYVVYGFGAPEVAYDPLVASVGKAISHAPKRVRRTGAAGFDISPALPTGLRLDEKTGVLSGTPQRAQDSTSYVVTITDLAGTAKTTLAIRVNGPPGTPPPTQGDTRAPQVVVRGPTPQRLLARKRLVVVVTCNEPCTATATGTVTIVGLRLSLALSPTKAQLRSAVARTLVLRLSPAKARRFAGAFKQGKRASVTVRVRAVDRSGNAAVRTRNFAVRR